MHFFAHISVIDDFFGKFFDKSKGIFASVLPGNQENIVVFTPHIDKFLTIKG